MTTPYGFQAEKQFLPPVARPSRETCPTCAGHGVVLDANGEPTHCRECDGCAGGFEGTAIADLLDSLRDGISRPMTILERERLASVIEAQERRLKKLTSALTSSRIRFERLGRHFGEETEINGVKASAALYEIEMALSKAEAKP